MHSFWSRISALSSWAFTVVGVLLVANLATDYYLSPPPPAPANLSLLGLAHSPQGPKMAIPLFSLDVGMYFISVLTMLIMIDLREQVHWNRAYLFVWVSVSFEWPNKEGKSEIVIWDTIIEDRESALIHIAKGTGEYSIPRAVADLPSFQLTLHYNTLPHSGLLTWGNANKR